MCLIIEKIKNMPYDTKTHGDFRHWYDTNQKRNYWVLGYFGGGSINIVEAHNLAKQFAEENEVSLSSVKMDEILSSRRYKGFKFMFSDEKNQKIPDESHSTHSDNVYAHLRD